MAQVEERRVVSFTEAAGTAVGVGGELRLARMRAGYELTDVSNNLRIRYRHLEAIENGQFDELPGPTYAVGFVRSYAAFLSLDGDDFVRRFKEEISGFSQQQDLRFPEPPPEGRVPPAVLVVLSLFLAGGVYLAWHYISTANDPREAVVAEVPDRLAEPAAEPPAIDLPAREVTAPIPVHDPREIEQRIADIAAATVESLPALVAAAPEPATEDAPEPTAVDDPQPTLTLPDAPVETMAELDVVIPAAPETVIAAGEGETLVLDGTVEAPADEAPIVLRPPSELEAPAPPAAAASPAETASTAQASEESVIPAAPESGDYVPRVYGQGHVDSRVVLRARADSWVQVQGSNNELLMTRILRPGDTYLVPNRSDLILITGNAGGLDVVVDGELLPPLGASGAVRRNVSLDPNRLMAEAGLR